MTRDDLLTLSQRLREYNHNPHHINPASDAFHGLITDSADALAQLAAIQGGMGEEPLVVATAILGGLFHGGSGPELGDIDVEVCTPHLEKIQCETVDSSDDVFMPLMTVAQHQRITAAMAAEVERLSRMLNNATNDGIKLADERDALSAQLRDANSLADQWAEKIAALSAQQSAPERVSVPVELLEQVLNVMDNYVTHETREEDQLRAILASHQRGEA